MPYVRSSEFELHPRELDVAPGAFSEEKRSLRLGLAVAGASLGASIGLMAVMAAGISVHNPIGWLTVVCGVAIGAVLGA